jgi:serine/threonine protein kinase
VSVEIAAGHQLLHYRIVEKLGEGGMGEVWLAEDTKLNRRVALKVLPQGVAADPDRRARFEREAQAVAALSHPNIVTIYSVEEVEGTHFITMELVEGQSLTTLLPRKGLGLNRVLEIAIPLAEAVHRAHQAGITHRDLKPDNIMVDDEGRLRVLDFGLAKLQEAGEGADRAMAPTATHLTGEGKIVGTVAYMSPEQAEGADVDHRSDIFALGTILYEMVSGQRPFLGDTSMSTIGSILKEEPASITELNPTLPRHAGRIIRRCLAKKPDRRYQTALDLRNELEDLKSELDSGVHSVEKSAAPNKRSWVPTAIVMLVVAVIAGVLLVQGWRQPDPSAAGFESRPLTSTGGWTQEPNWSPDGTSLALSRMNDGNSDILIMPLDGGEAVLRADGPGDEAGPRWSPDGKYLAFISSSEPGSWVHLVPAYGGTARKLIETGIPTLHFSSLRKAMGDRPWAIDGESLLVSRATDDGRIAVFRVPRGDGPIEQLTSPPPGGQDFAASYSFDGERIVFARQTRGQATAMILPAGGGEPTLLLDGEYEDEGFVWRPDNRHVVFISSRAGGTQQLFEIDVESHAVRPLTAGTRHVEGLSVSADNRIAYGSFSHDTLLYVANLETGEHRQITSHTADNFGPRFSTDGKKVAYHSTRTGNSEIWLHGLDGGPEVRFTDHPGWDLYPDWSPDDERLVFVSDRDGDVFKLFVANPDGGGGAQLLVDQEISWRLGGYSAVNTNLPSRWSPDGKLVGYLVTDEQGTSLWTVEANGENARKRLDGVTGFDWYVDNRHAVVSRPSGSEVQLFAVDLETGQEEFLFEEALTEFDVAPDGSALSFCYGRGHLAMGLAVLKLDSRADGVPSAAGAPEYVARSQGTWHVHNGGWSADSKSLVYIRDTDRGEIYELVEKQ